MILILMLMILNLNEIDTGIISLLYYLHSTPENYFTIVNISTPELTPEKWTWPTLESTPELTSEIDPRINPRIDPRINPRINGDSMTLELTPELTSEISSFFFSKTPPF